MATQLGYGEFMKKSLQRDRLEKEEINLRVLINNLNSNGAHKQTGIIYDITVLNSRLNNLIAEIKEITAQLGE